MAAGSMAGRTAVVTGAGRGLGRAIGQALAAAGARVVAVDLPAALSDLPAGWDGVAADLGAPDARDRLAALAARLGRVDAVAANAGVVPPWRGVEEVEAGEWAAVMAVNVWGVAATLGGFAGALAASGHGAAVVTASINGYRAHPRQVLYTASKHAVVGLMRAAALDLGPRRVRVNAIAPGPVATAALLGRLATRHDGGGPAPAEVLAAMAAETALGRMVTEAQVAQAALWLLSDASDGITGALLPVEAGLT